MTELPGNQALAVIFTYFVIITDVDDAYQALLWWSIVRLRELSFFKSPGDTVCCRNAIISLELPLVIAKYPKLKIAGSEDLRKRMLLGSLHVKPTIFLD